MQWIESLRSNVTREAALQELRGRGLSRGFRWLTAGPLRSIADVYVPYHLFRVEIRNAASRQEKLLALDAVCGIFDLYSLDAVPSSDDLIRICTKNRPVPTLNAERARSVLIDRLRRIVFRAGFFRVRNLCIEAESVPLELHVPYWVGFSGFGERANLSVIDGVRRRMEGGKVRQFFREWLATEPSTARNNLIQSF